MRAQVILAGGSHKHTDLSLTAQRTINFFPQRQEAGNEKSPYILESFYGLKPFAASSGLNRGIYAHLEILYVLLGTTLSSVSSAGVLTTLGTIPGDGRAVFEGINTSIVIVADGVAYSWDGTTFSTASDPDFETPNAVTVINNQALYDGDNGRFAVSDVGQPLVINALNFGTAESRADSLLRPYRNNTVIYMFGSKTIETWWNDGQGNPPFTRIEDGTIEIGLEAIHSIASDDQLIYFLGDDHQVYALSGTVPVPLLPLTIVRDIRKFAIRSDAVAWTMQIDSQWFYVIKFPSADRTFVYPRPPKSLADRGVKGDWFELSSGVNGARYSGDGYAFVYGKHLVPDEGGNILELDEETYTENTAVIKRTRVMAPIHAGLYGQPGKKLYIAFLRLLGATGTGLLTGQGANPQVMLRYSQDGENFSNEIRGDVGKLGTQTEVIFELGETFETWVFEITSTDPVYSNWHSASIEVEVAIE